MELSHPLKRAAIYEISKRLNYNHNDVLSLFLLPYKLVI